MEKLLCSLLGSWKTTIVGILAGLAIISTQLYNLLDGNPETVFDGDKFLAALAIFGIGALARDGDKSSEDVKLK